MFENWVVMKDFIFRVLTKNIFYIFWKYLHIKCEITFCAYFFVFVNWCNREGVFTFGEGE